MVTKSKSMLAITTPQKSSAKSSNKKRVVLTLDAEYGAEVFVAGTFNDWNPAQKQMDYSKEKGIYNCAMMLAPGTYEYKFRVNNVWTIDQANPNFTQNELGTLNNVLVVQ